MVFQPLALAAVMALVDRANLGVVLIGLSLLMLATSGLQLLLPLREMNRVFANPKGAPSDWRRAAATFECRIPLLMRLDDL